MDDDIYFGYGFDRVVDEGTNASVDWDMVVADLVRPMKSMAELVDAITTAAVAIAEADWGAAITNLVEGWNAIVTEAREPIVPRKVILERRQVWHKRSEAQYHERIAQSRSRLAMHARKVMRRQGYACKAR